SEAFKEENVPAERLHGLDQQMEGNKMRACTLWIAYGFWNLYKALVEAYESDKIILDTYIETVTLKRRRDDDADKDEEPSAEPEQGQRDAEKERSLSQQALLWKLLPGALAGQHKGLNLDRRRLVELKYHLEEVFKATTDQQDCVNPEGQQYPHNLLKPLPLIPNNRDRRVIPFEHFINNDLKYLHGGASSHTYITSITKTKAAYYGHIKWIKDLVPRKMWIEEPIGYDKHALWGVSHWRRKRQQFYGFAVNRESARDVYSKRRIITVTELKIIEWNNYKHLDWITVRRDDDKLYKFKEGDFKRLRIQDIEDMLLLLVQGKLTNLTNKDKKNRLMRIDELHKFSDGTLTDVHTALDDCLKGIRMQYLSQSIWRKSDKDRAAAMIQAIDKRLNTMRIMRSLERMSHLSQHYGVTWTLDYAVTSFKPARWKAHISSLRCKPLKDLRGDQGLHSSKNSTRSPMEITLNLHLYLIVHKQLILWFRWIFFDYRATLGFDSTAGGLDHVNPVIRLPFEHGISKDDKVPIILGRPMLATANARIDVFGKKISLEVGTKQITFDINERESPAIISTVCVINNYSKINQIDEPRNLEELLMSDDVDRDLSSFIEDSNLLPDLESQDIVSLSPIGSARLNDDSSGM
nr:hypothetical protein [Tanacetum cinerariifolium]